MANEKKKLQKAALGLQDSDDEDIEGDIDQQIETMLAPKRIVKEVKASAIGLPNLTGLSNFLYYYYIYNFTKSLNTSKTYRFLLFQHFTFYIFNFHVLRKYLIIELIIWFKVKLFLNKSKILKTISITL